MANTLLSGLMVTIFSLALGGCAVARGPLFDASTLPALTGDTARIILFRQSAPGGFGAGSSIPVKLDGQDFAEFPQLGYAWRDVPAGRHELSASRPGWWAGRARLVLDLSAGATGYVEVSHSGAAVASVFAPVAAVTATDSETGGPYSLVLTDPARAVSALSKCRRTH